MNRYQSIYKRLTNILPEGWERMQPGSGLRLRAPGFMDLHFDMLESSTADGRRVLRVALAHRYMQNGDSMADPDMEIRVYPDNAMAEALTYQQDALGLYQEVYPEPGKVVPALKAQLNRYLAQWLANIEAQGHSVPAPETGQ